MISGLALHALGFAAQQTRISIVALLIFTWGALRLAGGRRWGAAVMFPLGFMVFAIPLSVLDEVGLPLRLWVTSAGERMAHAAGIDVLRSGTQLIAPDGRFNYDVAAPCSGVRSLMALTALSLLVGYLNFRSWTRRTLVLVLCFPLVYLGNVARIVAIVFAAQWGGPIWGERAHQVMGYGVFVIVLGGVFGCVRVIRRLWPEKPAPLVCHPLDDKPACHLMDDKPAEHTLAGVTAVPSVAERENPNAMESGNLGRMRRGSAIAVSGAVIVVAFAIGEMVFLRALANSPPRGQVGVVLSADGQNPVALPAFLGNDWIGQRAEVSAVEREILPADTGFSRRNYVFLGDRKRDVFLSVVLSGRDRTSIHRPELCLVGQGWTIDAASQHAFRFPAGRDAAAAEFPATVLRVRREAATSRGKVIVPQLVSYWFVGGDTVVSSHWQRFATDAWNRVMRGRIDRWAYVLMQTDASDGEAAALARMQTILDGTLPVFQRPMPAD
jgi:exosortase